MVVPQLLKALTAVSTERPQVHSPSSPPMPLPTTQVHRVSYHIISYSYRIVSKSLISYSYYIVSFSRCIILHHIIFLLHRIIFSLNHIIITPYHILIVSYLNAYLGKVTDFWVTSNTKNEKNLPFYVLFFPPPPPHL